ncbi:MAG: hypothetical protein ABMB14_06305 [Myxococcota bacterium]
MTADTCFKDEGTWASEGACTEECLNDEACAGWGYPPWYHCNNDDGVPMCLHESLFP